MFVTCSILDKKKQACESVLFYQIIVFLVLIMLIEYAHLRGIYFP